MKVRTYQVPGYKGGERIYNSLAGFGGHRPHRRGINGVNREEESGSEYKEAHEWVYQGTSLLDES